MIWYAAAKTVSCQLISSYVVPMYTRSPPRKRGWFVVKTWRESSTRKTTGSPREAELAFSGSMSATTPSETDARGQNGNWKPVNKPYRSRFACVFRVFLSAERSTSPRFQCGLSMPRFAQRCIYLCIFICDRGQGHATECPRVVCSHRRVQSCVNTHESSYRGAQTIEREFALNYC